MGGTIIAFIIAFLGIGGTLAGIYLTNKEARDTAREQRQWELENRERARKEQVGSIRTLIRLEVERNLELLRAFWAAASDIEAEEGESESGFHARMVDRLLSIPLPGWRHTMWMSQLPDLALALSEVEITRTDDLHENLKTISQKCMRLAELRSRYAAADRAAIRRNAPSQATFFKTQFQSDSYKLYMEIDTLVGQVLGDGNPIHG